MSDSLGGTVIIIMIVVFILFGLGYVAFNVNYTKAFRMKDKIISLYNEHKGKCDSDCASEIKSYAQKIGYVSARINCPCSGSGNDGYCVCQYPIEKKSDSSSYNDLGDKYYYHVVTKININIPIFNKMIDLKLFDVSGDTEAFIA